MKLNNRTIRAIALLLMIATLSLSLTSCFLDLGYYYENMFGNNSQNGDGGGNSQDDGNGDGENNNENEDGENQVTPPSDDKTEDFYPGSGQGNAEGLGELSRTLLSTVTIVAIHNGSAGAGSGVFYSVDKEKGDAYIITNYHVIYGGKNQGVSNAISVYLYGMETSGYAVDATFVGGSMTYDIAILKVENSEVLKNSYATPITFADADKIRVFDRVYAIGNSEGGGMSATEGIVSVVSEPLDLQGADGEEISLRVMRIDAAVNHGNSGGGLYDESGRLVGIVSAKDVSYDVDNMGYAIPCDLVKKIVNNVLHYCDGDKNTQMQKALMGVTITAYVSGVEIDPEDGSVYEVELVEVVSVNEGSLADGKMFEKDVINSITVDGVKKTVTRVHHVTDSMIDAREGSIVKLEITRNGEKLEVVFEITNKAISPVK